jgi:riboflavin transporter FmnP
MKTLRAIGIGAILWVLIFFEVSFLMFGLGLNTGNTIYYALHFIFASLFTIVLSLWYFHTKKVKKGFLQGLLVGIIFVITGIILDSVITIPLFMKFDYSFLIRFDIGLMELWGIILCGLVGMIKK